MTRLLLISALFVGLLACATPSIVRRVSAGGFAAVQEGRYHGYLRYRNGMPEFERMASDWRRQIEGEPGFLRSVGEKYFYLPAQSEFRFMSVAEDSVQKQIVLRYFAYDPKPVIFAGWQLQFVFSQRDRSLVEVRATEVPLE